MNVTNNLRALMRTRCLGRSSCSRAIFSVAEARRSYATYRGMDFGDRSQHLSQSLDTKQRSEAKQDHVGPFQLGLLPSALRKGEKVQKWSELSTGGKGAHYLRHHIWKGRLLMLGLIFHCSLAYNSADYEPRRYYLGRRPFGTADLLSDLRAILI